MTALRTGLLLLFVSGAFAGSLPVVLWHGMGDSCCNPLSLGPFIKVIEDELPGTHVLSLQIGESVLSDITGGFFKKVNSQVEMACQIIANDTQLQGGYNAIGFSQGGQFLRAVAQRCPSPPMKTLISFGGQHQGIYGLPHCPYPEHTICDWLRKVLNKAAYASTMQNNFVQAQYWHDPLNEEEYREKSGFLADINNVQEYKEEYKRNLMKLENFVLVKFEKDTMVEPVDTEWFGFYTPGQGVDITPLRQSDIYTQDLLGLKEMDKGGRLKFLSSPGDHLQFTIDWFLANILYPYLK